MEMRYYVGDALGREDSIVADATPTLYAFPWVETHGYDQNAATRQREPRLQSKAAMRQRELLSIIYGKYLFALLQPYCFQY
ncbi:MAG: hypothetical protein WKF92_14845 [Pyrinomonadaceae bacterium]